MIERLGGGVSSQASGASPVSTSATRVRHTRSARLLSGGSGPRGSIWVTGPPAHT